MPDTSRDFLRNLVPSFRFRVSCQRKCYIYIDVIPGALREPHKMFSVTDYRKHCGWTRPLHAPTRHTVDASLNRTGASVSHWLFVSEQGSEMGTFPNISTSATVTTKHIRIKVQIKNKCSPYSSHLRVGWELVPRCVQVGRRGQRVLRTVKIKERPKASG